MAFRYAGHSVGGRVNTVAGVPSQPRTFYMGVASGGVFRSTDGGESWQPISDGKIPVASIGSIAVADSDPNVIWVGTGSDGARSNVSTGRGVYRSTDGGETWNFAGLYNAGQIGALRVHPTDPNTAWVSATGDLFKRNTERGIFRTTDGGRTWRRTLFLNDSTGAADVELKPGDPNTVYAWMARIERKPWTIISGSREGGFYKSTDGGVTFRKTGRGLPNGLIGKGNLAVSAANPERLYLLVEAQPGGGLYRSDDAGANWELVNTTPGLITRPFYYTTIGADPTNADVVYAGAENFYKSTDGGRTLALFPTPHVDNHDIWINPNDGQTMVQANDGGANVSFDGGRTWSTQLNQPTAEFYGVVPDNRFPYNLYSAQQDNNTWVWSSVANPFDADALQTGPGCETGPIMPHPTEPNIIYGSCKGQFAVMNTDSRQTRNYWIGGQSLYGNAGQDLIYRIQRTVPMAYSPHDPSVLYYGTQYVHRTRDKGVTWERISPDLTWYPQDHRQGASGEPITRDVTGEEFYSTLYAITESPHEPGVIWTGANDGPFHITRDGGATWTNITPKDLELGGRVAWIEASPHRPGSAYYATYRYLLGDYRPYIYRTDDYGATWTKLTPGTNGIAADVPTRVVREDPDREGLLYAGTEFGIYISFNNGASWQPFNLNMPQLPINQILVHKKDLIVATQGRGNWIFHNVTALHGLTPTTHGEALHVYAPRAGVRTIGAAAQYFGPQVDYHLAQAPSDTVRIEIRDARGALVNSYKSGVIPTAPARRRPPGAEEAADAVMMAGRGGPEVVTPVLNLVTAKQGFNRFTWGVQHQNGLGAPPGQYSVTVSVGEQSQTVPLTVEIDPRLAAEGYTAADLQEQFAHNLRMRAMVAEVNALIARARAAETRLAAAGASAADTLAAVRRVLHEQLLTQPVRYGKPGLQAHIQYLSGMTTRVDQKVGRDALERADVLRGELDAATAALNRAIGPAMRME
ncbi:MAG: hypothetical protein KF689_10305 [Gemmatimonadaceae bacterium]|nr:hypothetical protein [Gemmatimonadaceae bacterium]MCW5826011.1 hypothetical protein [Gemmatimonadaceae bacterium]